MWQSFQPRHFDLLNIAKLTNPLRPSKYFSGYFCKKMLVWGVLYNNV